MLLEVLLNMGKFPMYRCEKYIFPFVFCLLIGSFLLLASSVEAKSFSPLEMDSPLEMVSPLEMESRLEMEQGKNSMFHHGDSLYRAAQQFLETQNREAAYLLMQQAVEIDPDRPEYWELLLVIHQERGDVQGAISAVQELVRLVPEERQYYLDYAFLLTYSENYAEALDIYDTYLDRFGLDGQVVTSRARIFQLMDRPLEAIKELEALLEEDQTQLIAYVMLAEFYTQIGQPPHALTVLEEGQKYLGDQPLFNISRAEVLRNLGRMDESFEQLSKAFDSHMFDLDYKAGALYRTIGVEPPYSDDQILQLADQLVRQYPVSVKSHAVRGDMYAQFGQLEEAKSSYETAISMNSGVPQIWEQLISISNYLGLTADAKKHADQAAELFPDEPNLLFFVGNTYLIAGDHEKARIHMEAALNSTVNKETAYLSQIYGSLGGIYHHLDMHAASDVAYEEALSHDSLDVYSLNNYAYYLALRNEKLDRAIEMSTLAVQLQPNEATFEDTHAWVLYRRGEHQEALIWIKRALKNSEEPSATLLEHYGDILYQNGKVRDAVSQWKKAQKYAVDEDGSAARLAEKVRFRTIIE